MQAQATTANRQKQAIFAALDANQPEWMYRWADADDLQQIIKADSKNYDRTVQRIRTRLWNKFILPSINACIEAGICSVEEEGSSHEAD